MKPLEEFTNDEKSLLLFAECMCVDNGGIYPPERTNAIDRQNLDAWKELGFCDHGRVASECLTSTRTVWLKLSDEAMQMAHTLRRERAARMWKNRKWYSTAEKRAARDAEN